MPPTQRSDHEYPCVGGDPPPYAVILVISSAWGAFWREEEPISLQVVARALVGEPIFDLFLTYFPVENPLFLQAAAPQTYFSGACPAGGASRACAALFLHLCLPLFFIFRENLCFVYFYPIFQFPRFLGLY